MTGSFPEPILVESGSKSLNFKVEAGQDLHLVAFALGGVPTDSAQLSLTVDLVGPHASVNLHGLFVGNASINVRVNHLAPDTTSRQLVKGIVSGSAAGSFSGTIFVARDAQHTDAQQYSRNIQLSDSARITTSPQLEIYADDVKCSHGATIGRLDEDAIYYMRQRGISESEARRMQLEGFIAEIINVCPSEDFRDLISAKINENLSVCS